MKKIYTLALALFTMTSMAHAQGIVTTVTRTNGTTIDYESDIIENITFEESPWVSLGYCLYGEDFIGSCLYPTGGKPGDYCCQYYVEVQENTEQSGLYRLVNPYSSDAYPFYDNICSDYDLSRDTYIEIDATDPDGVFINQQKTGVFNSSFGDIRAYSYAAYCMDRGYTLDRVKASGYCGTLKDGKITFPTQQLRSMFSMYGYYGNYYYGNTYDNFLVDLNDKSNKPGAKEAKRLNAPSKEETILVVNDESMVK